jgi:hypothetical protein
MDKSIEKYNLINNIINDNIYIFDINFKNIYGLDRFIFIKKFIERLTIIRDIEYDNDFDTLLDIITISISHLESYIKTIPEGEEYKWIIYRDIIDGLIMTKMRIIQSSFYSLNVLFEKKLKF